MKKRGSIAAVIIVIVIFLVLLATFFGPLRDLFGSISSLLGLGKKCDTPSVLSEKIRVALNSGQDEQVFETYEKFKECYSDTEPMLRLDEFIDLYSIVVEKRIERGNYAGAILILEKIADNTDYFDQIEQFTRWNWLLGFSYYQIGRMAEAKYRLKKVNIEPYGDKAQALLRQIYENEFKDEVAALRQISSVALIKTEPTIIYDGWRYNYEIKFEKVTKSYSYIIAEYLDKKILDIERLSDGKAEEWRSSQDKGIIAKQINLSLGLFCAKNSCKKINVTTYGEVWWPLPPKTELEKLAEFTLSTVKKYEILEQKQENKNYEVEYGEDTYLNGKKYVINRYYNRVTYNYMVRVYRLDYAQYQAKSDGDRKPFEVYETGVVNEIKKDLKIYADGLVSQSKYAEAAGIYDIYLSMELGFGQKTFNLAKNFQELAKAATTVEARNEFYTYSLKYYTRYVDEIGQLYQQTTEQKEKQATAKREIEDICMLFALSFCLGIPTDIYFP